MAPSASTQMPSGASPSPSARPDSAVDERAVVGDRPGSEAVGVRFGDDQGDFIDDGHAVGEPDIVRDGVAISIREDDRDQARLAGLARHRTRLVHPCASCPVDDDLVEPLTRLAVARQVRAGHDAARRRHHQRAVRKPVDRERQSLDPRFGPPRPVGAEGQHLAGQPVAHPQSTLVPSRRFTHPEPGREGIHSRRWYRRATAGSGHEPSSLERATRDQLRIAVDRKPDPQLISSVHACRRVPSYLTDPYARWSPTSPPAPNDGDARGLRPTRPVGSVAVGRGYCAYGACRRVRRLVAIAGHSTATTVSGIFFLLSPR